jgi:hypothetical protein
LSTAINRVVKPKRSLGFRLGLAAKSSLIIMALWVAPAKAAAGTWTPLTHPAPDVISLMLLLSDGSVMAANGGGSNWFRLTPDIHGSYVNGTWASLAPMHDTRLWFSSDVLSDGRVFVAGGEYGSGGSTAETYDPTTDTWTPAPATLQIFLDSISKILPDGTVLVAPVQPNLSGRTLAFAPASNSWLLGGNLFGTANQSEASWVKLPDDSILTVNELSTTSQRYIPALNTWIGDGDLPVALYDDTGGEIGAGILLPDGRAFFLGGTGHTAFYTPSGSTNAGTWTAGPDIPASLATPDAPAAMMVNGKILCAVGPPVTISGGTRTYPSPTSFYEFDPVANTFTAVNGPTGLTDDIPPFEALMLDLPDGTVLYSHFANQLYVYQPSGSPLPAAKPTLASLTPNADGSFHLAGTLFNGISEGAAYGDDAQMAGNYPIVRLTNSAGNIYYARTCHWSSTSVMTGTNEVSTDFTLPPALHVGIYSLMVVANGVSSAPISFTNSQALRITPAGQITAGGTVGGPFDGGSQTYSLTNVGSSTLTWSLANTSNWINVSSGSGSLSPGGPAATVTVSLNPTATNLPAGIYSAALNFTNRSDGSLQSRKFDLMIDPPQLVQNPGFETGSFTGWTQSGNTSRSFVDNGFEMPARSGTNLAAVGRNATFGFLSQTIPTVAGQSYLLSLWLGNPSPNPTNEFLVLWNGVTNLDWTNIPPIQWTNLQFIVSATNGGSVIELGYRNTQTWFGLDDVTLQPVAVPSLAVASDNAGMVVLTWPSTPGLAYQVQFSTNPPSWFNLGVPIPASGSASFSDPIGPDPSHFYRLLLLP